MDFALVHIDFIIKWLLDWGKLKNKYILNRRDNFFIKMQGKLSYLKHFSQIYLKFPTFSSICK